MAEISFFYKCCFCLYWQLIYAVSLTNIDHIFYFLACITSLRRIYHTMMGLQLRTLSHTIEDNAVLAFLFMFLKLYMCILCVYYVYTMCEICLYFTCTMCILCVYYVVRERVYSTMYYVCTLWPCLCYDRLMPGLSVPHPSNCQPGLMDGDVAALTDISCHVCHVFVSRV